eukprot:3402316-Rhodomonas_salina.1
MSHASIRSRVSYYHRPNLDWRVGKTTRTSCWFLQRWVSDGSGSTRGAGVGCRLGRRHAKMACVMQRDGKTVLKGSRSGPTRTRTARTVGLSEEEPARAAQAPSHTGRHWQSTVPAATAAESLSVCRVLNILIVAFQVQRRAVIRHVTALGHVRDVDTL